MLYSPESASRSGWLFCALPMTRIAAGDLRSADLVWTQGLWFVRSPSVSGPTGLYQSCEPIFFQMSMYSVAIMCVHSLISLETFVFYYSSTSSDLP